MLNEIITSSVEGCERKISRHLRRWLGVPPSFTSIRHYVRTNQFQLPLSSLVEEFKVARARLVVTLKESKHDIIRKVGIETRTGKKWSAIQAVSQAESRLHHKDNVGVTTIGMQGLGNTRKELWSTAGSNERRKLVQEEIGLVEEKEKRAKAVVVGAQCAYTTWENTDRNLSWAGIWCYEPLRRSFLLRSVYDVLPSPANLLRWGLQDHPQCQLCGKTMEHILSACNTSLTQGRYRWRHDCVLSELASILKHERTRKRKIQKPQGIRFINEGQVAPKQRTVTRSIMDKYDQWEVAVDLKKKLVFPDIVQTTIIPDIFIWSKKHKCLIMIELTVPWESRCEWAYE